MSLRKANVFTCCIGVLALAVNLEAISDDEIETISVTAGKTNAAMKAFNAGDYELAEIEFLANAKCALRKERSELSFIEGVQSAQITSEVNGGGVNTGSSITDSNASRVEGASRSQSRRRSDDVLACGHRGFQLYMAGMSQLQLSRADEAEASFERAISLSKNQYDAHYRLALMKILRDDRSGAEKHRNAIKRMLKRCYDCDARSEIVSRVEFLAKALNGEVELR